MTLSRFFRWSVFPALLLSLLLFSGCIVIPVGDLLKGPTLEERVLARGEGFFNRDKIVIIEIEGIITGSKSVGAFTSSGSTVSELKGKLNRVKRDPDVRGVVLKISSPGGEVTACDVIHHEILEFKETSKVPVVAVIVDQGASGGYYVACAADEIIAHPTSVVGSIGVILQTFNVEGLFEKIGVETRAIKSAEEKDLLSPFRRRTPKEIQILQEVVDDLYERFVDVVVDRPGAPGRDQVRALADGRIVSGVEAEKLKLVDRVGYLSDALDEVKKRAGLTREPTVVRYARLGFQGANFYSMAGHARPVDDGRVEVSVTANALPQSKFLYLWRP